MNVRYVADYVEYMRQIWDRYWADYVADYKSHACVILINLYNKIFWFVRVFSLNAHGQVTK